MDYVALTRSARIWAHRYGAGDDTEDVAQEALLKLWRAAERGATWDAEALLYRYLHQCVRTILTKTDAGLIALVDALDLPDDLLTAKVRRYGPDHAYLTLADAAPVGIGFAFPTLERNIESARAFLAAQERRLASEAERAAQQAAKKGKRR